MPSSRVVVAWRCSTCLAVSSQGPYGWTPWLASNGICAYIALTERVVASWECTAERAIVHRFVCCSFVNAVLWITLLLPEVLFALSCVVHR